MGDRRQAATEEYFDRARDELRRAAALAETLRAKVGERCPPSSVFFVLGEAAFFTIFALGLLLALPHLIIAFAVSAFANLVRAVSVLRSGLRRIFARQF